MRRSIDFRLIPNTWHLKRDRSETLISNYERNGENFGGQNDYRALQNIRFRASISVLGFFSNFCFVDFGELESGFFRSVDFGELRVEALEHEMTRWGAIRTSERRGNRQPQEFHVAGRDTRQFRNRLEGRQFGSKSI